MEAKFTHIRERRPEKHLGFMSPMLLETGAYCWRITPNRAKSRYIPLIHAEMRHGDGFASNLAGCQW